MQRRTFLASTATLGGIAALPAPLRALGPSPQGWQIGPVIRGESYSPGMPLYPSAAQHGWYFDFPGPRRRDGHVHYVTRPTGALDQARGIRLRYRIDAAPGTRFVPQEFPDRTAMLSLFVQRAGDDWRARGHTQYHRWYSPRDRVIPLARGNHALAIRFDENWISVMGSDRERSPREFAETLAHASRVGFTLGSAGGRGHGVFATGPARFTVLDFTVL